MFYALRRSASRPQSGLKAKPPCGGFARGLGACHQQAESGTCHGFIACLRFRISGKPFDLVNLRRISSLYVKRIFLPHPL